MVVAVVMPAMVLIVRVVVLFVAMLDAASVFIFVFMAVNGTHPMTLLPL
jgi:hypothetical protein